MIGIIIIFSNKFVSSSSKPTPDNVNKSQNPSPSAISYQSTG
jgi:hypothetical protein